jgi:hypothetical protein
MSGAVIFATRKGLGSDGSTVNFAAAWGQGPRKAKAVTRVLLRFSVHRLFHPAVLSEQDRFNGRRQ